MNEKEEGDGGGDGEVGGGGGEYNTNEKKILNLYFMEIAMTSSHLNCIRIVFFFCLLFNINVMHK